MVNVQLKYSPGLRMRLFFKLFDKNVNRERFPIFEFEIGNVSACRMCDFSVFRINFAKNTRRGNISNFLISLKGNKQTYGNPFIKLRISHIHTLYCIVGTQSA